MQKFNFYFILFLFLFLLSCSNNINNKGKKGDFSFRKCSSCNISND